MDLDTIADELYGLPAAAFTAARDARAAQLRRDQQRDLAAAVKSLRRPSAGAEALNRLVRAEPEAISRLVLLGDQLRAAQARLSGDDLRTLGRQRRLVVTALGRAARDLARQHGHPLSAVGEREVADTLEAAIGDQSAAAALIGGRLTRALEFNGIGPDDLEVGIGGESNKGDTLTEAAHVDVARTAPVIAGGAADIQTAGARAAEAAVAEAAAANAVGALGVSADRADAASLRVAKARTALEDLERNLVSARRAFDDATADMERLSFEHDQARSLADELQRRAEAARRRSRDPGRRE